MLGEKTQGHHKRLLETLQRYCNGRGAYFIREFTR